jgi:hypothetical protein
LDLVEITVQVAEFTLPGVNGYISFHHILQLGVLLDMQLK